MVTRRRQEKKRPSKREIADDLHSAAIRLLRKLRLADEASGLSAPRLSALSVVVFAGPVTMTRLAEAEQVRLPTIFRLVQDLEAEGLLEKREGVEDRRRQWITATPRGRRLLEAGRSRRVEMLAGLLDGLSPAELRVMARSARMMRRILTDSGSGGSKARPKKSAGRSRK